MTDITRASSQGPMGAIGPLAGGRSTGPSAARLGLAAGAVKE
ncbi:hypothetical protein [Bifidobacterium sp. CP2]|nr:hypothetical protein [Bifidobacterium sp. CP2]